MKTCGCGAVISGASPEKIEKAMADHLELVHGQEPDALNKRVAQLEGLVREKNQEIADLKEQLNEKAGKKKSA